MVFFISAGVMLALALPRPRLYGYTAISTFKFLGFPIKLIGRELAGVSFVEPTGHFADLPSQWNLALLAASATSVAAAGARAAHLALSRRRPAPPEALVPPLYDRKRRAVWIVVAVVILGVSLLNLWGGIYQIGLEAKWILPLRLNVVAAWMVHTGGIVLLSVLVRWELELDRTKALVAPAAEGLLVSVSSISRSLFLLHVLPFALWLFGHEDGRAKSGRWKWSGIYLAGFLISVVLVMTGRIFLYEPVLAPEPAPRPRGAEISPPSRPPRSAPVPDEAERSYALREVGAMVIGRWIGVEGALAVASESDLSAARLIEVVREDPNKGEDSIYQRVAGAEYERSSSTTFLTLAGFTAILLFSGSLAVVLLGSLILVGLLIGVELVAQRAIGVPLTAGVMAVMIANVLAHMNFPYLAGIAFVQQLVAALGLGAVLRILSKRRNGLSAASSRSQR
jgi:hypothetical protein